MFNINTQASDDDDAIQCIQIYSNNRFDYGFFQNGFYSFLFIIIFLQMEMIIWWCYGVLFLYFVRIYNR